MPGDSLNSVESLIKKHEDFNRAIGLQEAKIMAIQATCDNLLASSPPHYASDCIQEKASKVLERLGFIFMLVGAEFRFSSFFLGSSICHGNARNVVGSKSTQAAMFYEDYLYCNFIVM